MFTEWEKGIEIIFAKLWVNFVPIYKLQVWVYK